jgi:hypothetical protein
MIGSFAPHEKNGITRIVEVRSFSVGKSSSIHHRRDGAAESHDHRQERATGEAIFAENLIQDEGDAGHIARVFKNTEKEEKKGDLREKTQNGEKAAHDAIADQADRPFGRPGVANARPRHLRQPVGAIRQ